MATMAMNYFGRDGRPCQRVEWARLRADASYRTVRQYDNGVVHVELEWTGAVRDASNSFRDCWTMFCLNVLNYDSAGMRRLDPVENGKTFPDEKSAISAYESFLVLWTNSHRDDEGGLIEEGNDLTPPPPPKPPDPDEPSSDVSNIKGLVDDGVGAW